MKYFKIDYDKIKNHMCEWVNDNYTEKSYKDELLDKIKNFSPYNKVVYLSQKVAERFITLMAEQQQAMKNYILTYNNMEDYERLVGALQFYQTCNTEEILEKATNELNRKYTKSKKLKTDLIILQDKTNSFIEQYAKLQVLAKPDVNLSSLKTYSGKDIFTLIKNGSIAVININGYGRARKEEELEGKQSAVGTRFGYFLTKLIKNENLDENEFNVMANYCPKTVNTLLNDLNILKISKHYSEEIISYYQDCVEYLKLCIYASAGDLVTTSSGEIIQK